MDYKIVTLPSPILRTKNAQIKIFDNKLTVLVEDMFVAMKKANGVGLAAPQIGLNLQLFVVDDGQNKYALANPKFSFKSKEQNILDEGCLSVPGQIINVKRSVKVRVKGIDVYSKKPIIIKAKGLLARILQHEIDHLNGTLIVDKDKND